jgi:hypothetical protein
VNYNSQIGATRGGKPGFRNGSSFVEGQRGTLAGGSTNEYGPDTSGNEMSCLLLDHREVKRTIGVERCVGSHD